MKEDQRENKKAIEIHFSRDYDQVEINLEDVMLVGNDQFESTIYLKNVNAGTKHLAFKDLRPSKYLIQLVSGDCKWVIGGFDGIIIKSENED